MGDCEDPEIYAAFPLSEFMDSPKGKWIKERCEDPRYIVGPCPETYGFKVTVYGKLDEKSAVEWYLRWQEKF